MSKAGKFIPGGAGRKTTGLGPVGSGKTGPIRAPTETPGGEPPKGKRLFPKGSGLVKPVAKGQRLSIVLMSAVVCWLLFTAAYYLAYLPEVRRAAAAEQQLKIEKQKLDDAMAQQQKVALAQQQQQSSARATITIDSKPSGANVTIGDVQKPTPASFSDLVPGPVTVLIHADGYEDYKKDLTVTADKPTDLGTIELVQKAGSLSLSSPQGDVTYSLTGPGGFSREGALPDKFDNLLVGDYQLTVQQHDWKLAPMLITIYDQENVQKEIKFPYANAVINSVPSGATVRNGRVILGQTPLTLPQIHPGDLNLSIDLPPYTLQRFVLSLPDFGNVTKDITMEKGRDFIAACGLPMIWISEGGYWAAKYEMPQGEFETVAGFNPSTFRRTNRPVETITWDAAMVFCQKLTQYERKEGKLPPGYHYTLPTESQWAVFSADADINQAAMSRTNSLASTEDVGASEPNKYGIYDTLGNVWEWCLDLFDDKGDHSMRGGGWLSSAENFPGPDTRNGAPPTYSDRFTGFRVVLVPDN